ncbi:ESS family glutamate:Na+ symporter [Candidatus Kinetoplastibacterium desouzaii TCC079E]|uniref:Sodium/glutamate symporter n=1 Tax=Candidatus Kinetoplastidibacterium desouzai TCC079E TaxID=1208919 RepID=M1M4K5_9PROT|nr:sodium/glutamate symporter [Candidatus Kinetoplastibacterium desouzaii]AGF47140.1 ESS family glutamate:Na+ symporter [Candidatus Kinetoplastibacterium desouzaii TCC079E]
MISLSLTQSLLACCLVLLGGRYLTSNIRILAKYSVPDPIVGGLVFAALTHALSAWGGIQIYLDTATKPTFLLMFFGCVGLTANLKLLTTGGSKLIALLIVLVPFLILQNIVGLALASLLDMHPLMGLIGGTITLVGGHGTGAAYAARFADINNIQNITALAMTSATIGLVFGGVLGGPVSEWLIKHHKIITPVQKGERTKTDGEVGSNNNINQQITPAEFITSLCVALITLVGGTYLSKLVGSASVSLPNFLWCLALGIILRNLGPIVGLKLNDRATDILGTVMLSLFLGLTMMTLDLASAARLAGPLAFILVIQSVVCALYCCLVVFKALEKDYEAAVMSGAFCGIGLGTTATAIANMQAITGRHGSAPQSFIVIPLTGAFLVDIINVIILTTLISLPFVGGV